MRPTRVTHSRFVFEQSRTCAVCTGSNEATWRSPEASLLFRLGPVLSSRLTGGPSGTTLVSGQAEPPGRPQQHRLDSLASGPALAAAIFTNRRHGGPLKASHQTAVSRRKQHQRPPSAKGKQERGVEPHTHTHTEMEVGECVPETGRPFELL